MSVKAISWALNLAPVPRDRSGKRNPACKAVLVGLANHAAPDGEEAFPSVRTLVRYTDLSERTALDRLEAESIIEPCDPAVVAAKIKPADQRPQALGPRHASSATTWTTRSWRRWNASSRA